MFVILWIDSNEYPVAQKVVSGWVSTDPYTVTPCSRARCNQHDVLASNQQRQETQFACLRRGEQQTTLLSLACAGGESLQSSLRVIESLSLSLDGASPCFSACMMAYGRASVGTVSASTTSSNSRGSSPGFAGSTIRAAFWNDSYERHNASRK